MDYGKNVPKTFEYCTYNLYIYKINLQVAL